MLCEFLAGNCWAKMLQHSGRHSGNSWQLIDVSALAGKSRQKVIRVSWLSRCHLGPLCTSSVTPQPLCCPRRECIFKISWQPPGREPRGEKGNRERGILGLDTQRKYREHPSPENIEYLSPEKRIQRRERREEGRRLKEARPDKEESQIQLKFFLLSVSLILFWYLVTNLATAYSRALNSVNLIMN